MAESFEAKIERCGAILESTAGGCTAYRLQIGDLFALITDEGGADRPIALSECIAGFYDSEGFQILADQPMLEGHFFPSLEDYIAEIRGRLAAFEGAGS